MDKENVCCQNCSYWVESYEVYGYCHRYAPKPVVFVKPENLEDYVDYEAAWPSTGSDDFCGEFKAQ